MRKIKSAFTLSEILIAIGVVGVLAAVLLPIVHRLIPNQNILMARRAFGKAQAAVYDLINDTNCYPDKTRDSSNSKIGFDDGAGYAKCVKWNASAQDNYCDKFATLFANKLSVSIDECGRPFTTDDGITWEPESFNNDGSMVITIDVNGPDKGPNCSRKVGTTCTSNWDIFQIKINPNGKMEIGQQWARNAVKVDQDFIGPGSDESDGLDDEDYI
ncbi:type II secretion system protein [bacterium]|nr:type II secretion system protein [bacterium]